MYNTIAIIVAAGRGTRMGSAIPKQYVPLGGISSLERSIILFQGLVDAILVVIHQDDLDLYQPLASKYNLLPYATHGELRQNSVKNGLEKIAEFNPRKVLIHDAARPFVSREVISQVIMELDDKKAVIAAAKVVDTIKQVENHKVVATLNRDVLYQIQTPQGFDFATIIAAHRKVTQIVTDDASMCELIGIVVHIVESSQENFKITLPGDLDMEKEIRVGMGFDAHRFCEASTDNNTIPICGVHVASPFAIEAHSDGDVALHALVDAMLGCIAGGDIGMHFPPTDPKWKDVDSSKFVLHALDLIKQKNGEIVNVDITIIGETPRVGPYRQAMQQRVAEILGLSIDRVNIKATTTEKMGFTGRKEGLAAQAIVSVRI